MSDNNPNTYANTAYNNNYAYSQTRSFKDIFLLIRERIWHLIFVFLLCACSAILYCFKATPIYEGVTLIQILRDDPAILDAKSIESADIKSVQDFNTQVKILESAKLISSTLNKVKESHYKSFIAPYEEQNQLLGALSIPKVIQDNRSIVPIRSSLMVAVKYYHPDPEVAAFISNTLSQEYINYKIKLDVENSMRAVDDLRIRAHQQKNKVEEIENKMAAYRETNHTVSLDNKADIDHQELTAINTEVTHASVLLDQASGRNNLVKEYLQEDKDLTALDFIAVREPINSLLINLSNRKIDYSSLSERYGPNHPKMIELTNNIKETQVELKTALSEATKVIKTQFQARQQEYDSLLERLAKKEDQILNLSRVQVEYNSLSRDLNVNQSLYNSMVMRLNTELAQINIAKPNARIIDQAAPAADPVKPNKILLIAAGVGSGLFLGLIWVLFLGHIDDRAKSAFDIETVIGIPLLGLVPRSKIADSTKKAKAVIEGQDLLTVESFRSLHSTLALNKETKNAQVFIITSTQPSEGKTFVAANLAATFANHSHKTLVVDADLRLPSLGKLLTPNTSKGLIDYIEGNASFEEVINTHTDQDNQHFVVSGGKAKHPTQLLNSVKFEDFIQLAREQYDRIIIDTPPMASVSDALNVLGLGDALVYVVKFNFTPRATIRYQLSRIADADIALAGAVMNQVSLSTADYYYNTAYSKSYTMSYLKSAQKEEKLKKSA